jgi:D-tyrosyl-tRNA(Tyr) deacylase
LVQRVTRASVAIQADDGAEEITGEISAGLVAFVGVTHDDGSAHAAALAAKIWHLRVFEGRDGRMDRPVADVGGEVLVVSQFTLYGDTRKGRRPSWVHAARPEQAEPLVEAVCEELRSLGATVAQGRFRADMAVALVNDGPVTLLLEV